MKRAWTRGEKWLWATPLLFGVVALGAKFGPDAARRSLGYPTELSATPTNSLTSMALSRDGRILVAGEQIHRPTKSTTNTIYAWDARTFQPLPPLTRPANLRDSLTYCVALSPDAKTLTWSSIGIDFFFTDFQTRRVLWTTGWRNSTNALFSSDGKWVAMYAGSGKIGIFEARTGKAITSWNLMPQGSESSFEWSPRGRYFASVGGRPRFKAWSKAPNETGGKIELRRVSDWKVERIFPLRNADDIAFSPDERAIIGITGLRNSSFGYSGSRLSCFDVASGKIKWELDSRRKNADVRFRFLNDACYSPDGLTVALFPSQARQVFLLDANTGEIKRTLRISAAQVPNSYLPHALAFSPDGKRLFARGKSAVLVWDLKWKDYSKNLCSVFLPPTHSGLVNIMPIIRP